MAAKLRPPNISYCWVLRGKRDAWSEALGHSTAEGEFTGAAKSARKPACQSCGRDSSPPGTQPPCPSPHANPRARPLRCRSGGQAHMTGSGPSNFLPALGSEAWSGSRCLG